MRCHDPYEELCDTLRSAKEPLRTAFAQVEIMSEPEVIATWQRLIAECRVPSGLCPMWGWRADLCQVLAARLDIRLTWKSYQLDARKDEDGRGEETVRGGQRDRHSSYSDVDQRGRSVGRDGDVPGRQERSASGLPEPQRSLALGIDGL